MPGYGQFGRRHHERHRPPPAAHALADGDEGDYVASGLLEELPRVQGPARTRRREALAVENGADRPGRPFQQGLQRGDRGLGGSELLPHPRQVAEDDGVALAHAGGGDHGPDLVERLSRSRSRRMTWATRACDAL
jgi:hypothetical protein